MTESSNHAENGPSNGRAADFASKTVDPIARLAEDMNNTLLLNRI